MNLVKKYTVIAGLVIALSMPAFAGGWRGGGGFARGGGAVAHVGGFSPQISHFSAPARSFAGNFRTTPAVVTRTPTFSRAATTRTFSPGYNATLANNRFTQTRVNSAAITRQTNVDPPRNTVTVNRSNNYGGRWSAAGAHPNWNRNAVYFWHNHYYRWWNGGWLICDNGFWPYAYPYYDYPYYGYDDSYNPAATSSSTVSDVQSDLAQLGYYNGDIDGEIGPLTRQAIANYQSDHGLPVTGGIDQALLASLGLE